MLQRTTLDTDEFMNSIDGADTLYWLLQLKLPTQYRPCDSAEGQMSNELDGMLFHP